MTSGKIKLHVEQLKFLQSIINYIKRYRSFDTYASEQIENISITQSLILLAIKI